MESVKDCKVTYPPRRILQRKRNRRLKRKKKDNCGSEMFEERGDGINAKWKGCVLTGAGRSLRFNRRERRGPMDRCRSGRRFGGGNKRDFSSDCLYFLSEVGVREHRRFEEIKCEIVVLLSRQLNWTVLSARSDSWSCMGSE